MRPAITFLNIQLSNSREDNGADCVAKKPVSGKSWDCAHETDTCYMGFPHLYYPSNPAFARHFVEAAAQYEKQDTRGK